MNSNASPSESVPETRDEEYARVLSEVRALVTSAAAHAVRNKWAFVLDHPDNGDIHPESHETGYLAHVCDELLKVDKALTREMNRVKGSR